MSYFGPTYEEHTKQVQDLLNRADISRRSMLTSEQVFNCYRLLDSDEWEVMAPNSIRNEIMGGQPLMTDTADMQEWEAKSLDRGTGLLCPECEGKLIVNFDALDDTEVVVCPYCSVPSTLPEDAE